MKNKTILITGGYGFIGSSLIRELLKISNLRIINIDKLTYAANLNSLRFNDKNNYEHYELDICDRSSIIKVFEKTKPDFVIHLAAETHVDRSIDGPDNFISTNIWGTYNLLKVSYDYWKNLNNQKKDNFRFLHVSTDEVYGSLGAKDKPFNENDPYSPNSPYSASKASSDHLVSAWGKTYDLPVLITNTCNNYGPWQFPEKLIPLCISKCLLLENIPIYGDGLQVRDWIYVDDHVSGILTILKNGEIGEKYNIGSNCEITNINVVKDICKILNAKLPGEIDYSSLIKKVKDRPGHDFRYAINNKKILKLGWHPKYNWEEGLNKTIEWYLDNKIFLDESFKKIIQVNVLVKYEKIKNVLLLGGNGQVGSEIKNINFSEKYNIISPNRSTLNLLNTNEIINFLDKNNFDFIINSSAYTDVDKAEVDKVNADTLNHKVPEILSVEAKKRDIGLIHISTDYVFGKDNCGPYKYDSQKNPCNFYGLTKSLGEMAVLKFCKNSTIIRIASVFSCYGDNFVKKIVNLVINQKEINVVNDQYISLTNANIFAQNIPQFIKINCINRDVQSEDLKIIHFTNFNYATWHKVSLVILDELKIIDKKINCIINPITSKKWKSNAVRPDDSRLVLDHDLLKKNDIINESWEISVRNTVRELYNNN